MEKPASTILPAAITSSIAVSPPVSIPRVYVHSGVLPRAGWVARIIALVVALLGLASLLIAMQLTPSPTGVETHTQLGMSRCGMLASSGVPCAACGMTTSFAHLMHGSPFQSLHAQPMGTLVAFLAACGFWIGSYIAFTGLPATRWLEQVLTLRVFFILIGLGLAGWAYKVLTFVA